MPAEGVKKAHDNHWFCNVLFALGIVLLLLLGGGLDHANRAARDAVAQRDAAFLERNEARQSLTDCRAAQQAYVVAPTQRGPVVITVHCLADSPDPDAPPAWSGTYTVEQDGQVTFPRPTPAPRKRR